MTNDLKNICGYLLNKDAEMTNLVLQKLLYFIQVASVIYLNKKAFKDKIEAWQYGPVVPNAYKKYKYDYSELKSFNFELNNNLQELVDIIYDYLGTKTAFELVNLTHSYSSWKEAWNDNNSDKTITIEAIEKCHKKIAKEKSGFIF